VTWLEEQTDRLNEDLPPLKNFILPGGSRAAAICHLARTVCRRAERDLVALAAGETVSAPGQHYLNRLSDLLFVTARVLARRDGGQEVLWQQQRKDL
jgi:cob(I)alamin adenosyltransferase